MSVGLMFRKRLKQNECMLFLFPDSGRHPIWMHNMRFPIDILWLDEKKRVAAIEHNARPLKWYEFSSYNPNVGAKYVVELASGSADRLGVKLAMRVHW